MKHGRSTLLATLAVPLLASAAFAYDPLQPIDRNLSYLEAKIKAVIHALGEGVNKQNFSQFRESYVVSSLVTKRISEQDLRDASRSLIDGKVDLTRLDDAKPIMDGPPQEDADHQLLISGHYDTSPPLKFRMGFIREGSHLGLSKINLNLEPSASADTTAPAAAGPNQPTSAAKPTETARPGTMIDAGVLAALLSDTPLPQGVTLPADQRDALNAAMHAFTLGVTSHDMDAFLRQDIVSPRWRQAQTGAQLAMLYRTTIERGADFAKFDGGEVIVPQAPATDASGELSINGLIVASDKERIAFRAGFEREGSALKLINLLVARSRSTVK